MRIGRPSSLTLFWLLACTPSKPPPTRAESDTATAPRPPASPTPRFRWEAAFPPARGGACAAVAATYCGRYATCRPTELAAVEGDEASCVARYVAWCERARAAPGTGLTEASLNTCRDQLATIDCTRWVRLEDAAVDACHPRGTRADGAPCADDHQCAGGFCRPARKPWFHDGRDLECGQCARIVKAGETCGDGTGQKNGCMPGFMCPRGICIDKSGAEGRACAFGAWFDTCYGSFPHPVQRDIACLGEGEDVRCKSVLPRENAPRFAPLGAACDGDAVRCGGQASCVGGRCDLESRPGDACDDDCPLPLSCVDGVCGWVDPEQCDALGVAATRDR